MYYELVPQFRSLAPFVDYVRKRAFTLFSKSTMKRFWIEVAFVVPSGEEMLETVQTRLPLTSNSRFLTALLESFSLNWLLLAYPVKLRCTYPVRPLARDIRPVPSVISLGCVRAIWSHRGCHCRLESGF